MKQPSQSDRFRERLFSLRPPGYFIRVFALANRPAYMVELARESDGVYLKWIVEEFAVESIRSPEGLADVVLATMRRAFDEYDRRAEEYREAA